MFISRAFHIKPLQINFHLSLFPATLNFKENMGDHLKNSFQIFLNVSFHVTFSIHLTLFRFLIIRANNYVAIKKEGASLVTQMVRIWLQCRRSRFNRWVGKILWRRKWTFQYSYLENSMDRGAWQAKVHGVAESDKTELLTLSLFMPVKVDKLPLWGCLERVGDGRRHYFLNF